MKKPYRCLLSLSIIFLIVSISWAEEVILSNQYFFRVIRGPNDIGYFEGDRLAIGASVDRVYSNVDGMTQMTASYNHEGVPISVNLPYVGGGFWPLSGEYGNTYAYNPAYTDSWLLTATNGTNSDSIYTHSLGNVALLPFVHNVQLTGAGLTPTISWEVPPSNADSLSIVVHAANGFRLWQKTGIAIDVNSYTIPEGVLLPDTPYVFRVRLEDRSIINGATISRSDTFVKFTPLDAGSPNTVFLPEVGPDTNTTDNYGAAYQFDCNVTQGEQIFLDPFVAVGYDYRISENNPLFASVTLPVLGDNVYDLYYLLSTGEYQYKSQLTGGEQYFFEEGIDFFRILGIEESLSINPDDVTAFITGLTFTGSGTFTGSMTPILSWVDEQVAPVPEPATMLLLSFGLIGIVGIRRFKK
jgi:hypothetical protein